MSTIHTLITRETPANIVLGLILSNDVKYPCLSSLIYQLVEKLTPTEPDLADECLLELNRILGGQADPASVRRFSYRHAAGQSAEARAFMSALHFLINEDEARRTQYLAMSAAARRHFIKCRLELASDIQIEQDIAL